MWFLHCYSDPVWQRHLTQVHKVFNLLDMQEGLGFSAQTQNSTQRAGCYCCGALMCTIKSQEFNTRQSVNVCLLTIKSIITSVDKTEEFYSQGICSCIYMFKTNTWLFCIVYIDGNENINNHEKILRSIWRHVLGYALRHIFDHCKTYMYLKMYPELRYLR